MPRAVVFFICAIAMLTVSAGAVLIAGIPTVQQLPGWFWPIHGPHLLATWPFLILGVALPFVVWLVCGKGEEPSRRRIVFGLAVLMIFGFFLQHGVALSEGRGANGMRDRIVYSGHAEFARTGSRDMSAWDVLTGYESFMELPGQSFARSKPPGQLLFYMALSSVADVVMLGQESNEALRPRIIDHRHRRLVDFATIAMPMLSTLVVIPLTLLASYYLPRRLVLYPALVLLLSAPTVLITLHLDQALYPLIATTLWALAARAGTMTRRIGAWSAAAGAIAWLGVFVSFSLLPTIVIAMVITGTVIPTDTVAGKSRRLLPAAVGFVSAFVLLAVLAKFLANYDMIFRFRSAMAHHQAWIIAHHPQWRGWPELPRLRLLSAALNLTEFGYWVGIPLVGLLGSAILVGIRSLARRRATGIEWMAPCVGLVLVAASLFGGSIGEVARLWIFMVPLVVLVAVERLGKLAGRRTQTFLFALSAAQLAWTFLLKAKQDFW